MTRAARHRKPLFEVRHSRIHGYGVFALRRIRKGTMVIEYLGDRVSHTLANERYEHKDPKDGHTFLFTVDAKTVIDAGVDGNEARFINHGCDPNCQTVNTNKRIFIEALRTVQPGEELAYDYQIQRDDDDPADVDVIFACRCGAKSCRGSMLEAPKKKRKSSAKRTSSTKRTSGSKRKPGNKRRRAPKRKAVRKRAR
jgi:SET domain-containing protein